MTYSCSPHFLCSHIIDFCAVLTLGNTTTNFRNILFRARPGGHFCSGNWTGTLHCMWLLETLLQHLMVLFCYKFLRNFISWWSYALQFQVTGCGERSGMFSQAPHTKSTLTTPAPLNDDYNPDLTPSMKSLLLLMQLRSVEPLSFLSLLQSAICTYWCSQGMIFRTVFHTQ